MTTNREFWIEEHSRLEKARSLTVKKLERGSSSGLQRMAWEDYVNAASYQMRKLRDAIDSINGCTEEQYHAEGFRPFEIFKDDGTRIVVFAANKHDARGEAATLIGERVGPAYCCGGVVGGYFD